MNSLSKGVKGKEEQAEVQIPYLVWTCYNLGKRVALLLLTLDDSFDDAGVIRAEVDKDISNTELWSRSW